MKSTLKYFVRPYLFAFSLPFLGLLLWNCNVSPFEGQSSNQEMRKDPTKLVFAFPKSGAFTKDNFYDFPYPHTLRLDADGTPALGGFPLPKRKTACPKPNIQDPLVGRLVDNINPDDYIAGLVKTADKQSQGFSLNPSIFFRFQRGLHPATIPPISATITKASPIFLIDIDPKSPRKGERIPLKIHPGLESRFFPSPTVVLRPFDGFPLRAKTMYAAVILTKNIRDKDGWPITTSPEFQKLASKTPLSDPIQEKLRKSYEPMFTFLASQEKIEAKDIAAATVFVTGDPLKEQYELYEFVSKKLPAPKPPLEMKCSENSSSTPYITCTGLFESPEFQNGSAPFIALDSGVFTREKDGTFKYRMGKFRFALTIPKQYTRANAVTQRPMPVVMYGHGTGGSYRSFINNSTARRLALAGIAGFGIDQAVNGNRTTTVGNLRLDFLFFNAINLPAARDNIRQSAADYHWQVRFLKLFKPAYKGQTLSFDHKRIWFMGHSQGGLIAPLFLALEKEVHAAYLSAPGALLVNTLLHKTEPAKPIKIPDLLKYMLCDPKAENTPFQPVIGAVQNFFDPADPINFAPLLITPDRPHLHLLMTEGLTDRYAPPEVFDPLAVAAGLPILGKVHKPLPGLQMRQISAYPLPTRGNYVNAAGQRVTVGFTQHKECKYASGSTCDGHFVSTNNPNALQNWITFFHSLMHDSVAQVH